jgi:hypothetical protein
MNRGEGEGYLGRSHRGKQNGCFGVSLSHLCFLTDAQLLAESQQVDQAAVWPRICCASHALPRLFQAHDLGGKSGSILHRNVSSNLRLSQ